MLALSPDRNAAIRAMRGESDMDAVRPEPGKEELSRVVACALETPRIVRAVAAICGDLTALIDAPTIADSALHDILARLIRTPENALWGRVKVSPAGWVRMHAAALVRAVYEGMCAPKLAAALIGPCDESAALLSTSYSIAFATGGKRLQTLRLRGWMHFPVESGIG